MALWQKFTRHKGIPVEINDDEIKQPAPNVDYERWNSVKRLVSVLQKAQGYEWSWAANTRCKYIDVRIDMRGHSVLIKDREGNIISLDDLEYQINNDTKFKTQSKIETVATGIMSGSLYKKINNEK